MMYPPAPDLAALLHFALAEPSLPAALVIAGTVAALAVPIGFCLALLLHRAGHGMRVVALGLCVVLLLQSGGAIPAPPWHILPPAGAWLGLALAVFRASAACVLCLIAGLARVPAHLRSAARAAGARPFQAWRHAVLRPLAWPLLAAFSVAFCLGLASGPLRPKLLKTLDFLSPWPASPALLLAIACLATLGALLRRRAA